MTCFASPAKLLAHHKLVAETIAAHADAAIEGEHGALARAYELWRAHFVHGGWPFTYPSGEQLRDDALQAAADIALALRALETPVVDMP